MSVRTTMLILVLNEFPTFTITRLSITLLDLPICRGLTIANPTAKITIFSQLSTIQTLKSLETHRKRIALNITNAP